MLQEDDGFWMQVSQVLVLGNNTDIEIYAAGFFALTSYAFIENRA